MESLKKIIENLRTEDNQQLIECVESGYNVIFEGVDYLKTTSDLATRLYNYFINVPPEEWHGKKIKFNRDDHYIIYRFNDVESIPRINIMADRKRRNIHGIYARMLHTGDPMIVCPIVDDDLWDSWIDQAFWNTPEDIINHLRNTKSTAIHEFIHLIDDMRDINKHKISDKVASKLVPGIRTKMPEYYGIPDKVIADEAKYLNKPTEFNARFLTAVKEAIANGDTDSFFEFKQSVRYNTQMLSIPDHFTPENTKRYMKWLYLAYEAIKAGELK